MNIQKPHTFCHRPRKRKPGDPSPKHSGGFKIPMKALHIGHDVAMIGMNLPGSGHSHGAHSAHGAHTGHHHHGTHGAHHQPEPGLFDGFTKGSAVHKGLTITSAVVAAGAAQHGIAMLGHGHYAHGASNLLMAAGSGTMAAAMATGSATLHKVSGGLMVAHGLGEAGLGVQSYLKADSTRKKAIAATNVLHGACLAASQLIPNQAVSLSLLVAMGAATAANAALSVQ